MILTRVQALALAVGLILVGVAAAWGFPSGDPDPAQLDQGALTRGDLELEQSGDTATARRAKDPVFDPTGLMKL